LLKGCETCCFDCANSKNMRCEDYAPAGYEAESEFEDMVVEELIDDGRIQFIKQWFEYISEYE